MFFFGGGSIHGLCRQAPAATSSRRANDKKLISDSPQGLKYDWIHFYTFDWQHWGSCAWYDGNFFMMKINFRSGVRVLVCVVRAEKTFNRKQLASFPLQRLPCTVLWRDFFPFVLSKPGRATYKACHPILLNLGLPNRAVTKTSSR